MAKTSMKVKQKRAGKSTLPANTTDAKSVAGRMPIFASSEFAVYALGSLLIRARFPGVKKASW